MVMLEAITGSRGYQVPLNRESLLERKGKGYIGVW